MKIQNALQAAAATTVLTAAAFAAHLEDKGPCVWLATDVIGMNVISQKGDKLGKIEDVVVHPGGAPSYVVLSFGGWLGMNEKLFAMPWSVLRSVESETAKKDSDLALVLPLDKERLKNAPGFDKKNWPSMANQDWTKDVDAFYKGDLNPNAPKHSQAKPDSSVISWRVTELKGTDILNPTGDKLADIKEVAIDLNGRVRYVALSVGGFLGMGDRLIAVPWESLTFSLAGTKGDKKIISMAHTKQQIEKAPEYLEGKENCALMCDPKWITRVYDYFSCPVYWSAVIDRPLTQGSQH